jgi:hypothetical protein
VARIPECLECRIRRHDRQPGGCRSHELHARTTGYAVVRRLDDEPQGSDLGSRVALLAALVVVVGADAEVGRGILPHRERSQDGVCRVAERDDQVPRIGGVVQPEVDDGEVRRLAAVDVEQGDGVEVARIQPPVDLEQLGGVGDEAGVVVGAEVPACASNAVRIAGSLRRFFVGSKKATSVATKGKPRSRGSASSRPKDFSPAAWTAVVVARSRLNDCPEKRTVCSGAARGVGTAATNGWLMLTGRTPARPRILLRGSRPGCAPCHSCPLGSPQPSHQVSAR